MDSPPDRDSLEIISVAAATLSSILTTNDTISERNDIRKIISEELESPDDSGVCTETTSLDRYIISNETIDIFKKSCKTNLYERVIHFVHF